MGTDHQAAATKSTTRRTTLFRWINAARYVVALAMTVLIVVMIAHAIKVVGRERTLTITVTGGSIKVVPPQNQSGNFSFILTIQAFNPSGFGRVYYTNVRVSVAGKIASSSSSPQPLPPTRFYNYRLHEMAVVPRSTFVMNSVSNVNLSGIKPPAFHDFFSKGNTMRDAVLRINGTLQTELYYGHNTTGHMAVYCCKPIIIGDVDDDYSLNQPTHDITSCTGPDTTMQNCEMI